MGGFFTTRIVMIVLWRWVYCVILTLFLPWVFLRLWLRGFKLKAYRDRWLERMGRAPLPPLSQVVWVHAVSVGEAMAAILLIKRLREQLLAPILMTTTTPTGSARIQAAFKDVLGKKIYHCYLPYDLPWILRPFLNRIDPRLLILMESELWPNLLALCAQRKVPVIVANARLSPLSFQRYHYWRALSAALLRPLSLLAVQSELDAKRFCALGVPPEKVKVTGNIKFDLNISPDFPQKRAQLQAMIGARRVFIAASTHEGEEKPLVAVYKALKKTFPNLLLFLVPRHPDRFLQVAQLCQRQGLQVVKRSEKKALTPEVDVFLGDTLGELLLFYATSDIAFVGGSWVPVGGHNLIEPAALGLPVLTGPQLFNFTAISRLLLDAGGAVLVKNQQALEDVLTTLLNDPALCLEKGQAGQKVVEKNRGALDKLAQLILNY